MDLKEKLRLFKAAKWDWMVPQFISYFLRDYTKMGLCFYFSWKHKLTDDEVQNELMPLWYPYSTASSIYVHSFHFHNRKERLHAIKKVIKDLEQAIELQHKHFSK